jgi:Na+-transporting methylmalonyl-CoA/oxaloacetate decarboxylase gamma subunit
MFETYLYGIIAVIIVMLILVLIVWGLSHLLCSMSIFKPACKVFGFFVDLIDKLIPG